MIRETNARLWLAVAVARINPGTEARTELRDAINARRRMRTTKLTRAEREKLWRDYLRREGFAMLAAQFRV